MFQNKKIGQVFLHDKNILRKIVSAANIQPEDIVAVIGCGEGILSKELALIAQKLYVLEIDARFIEKTQILLKDFTNVTFIHGDVLKNKFLQIPEPKFKIAANIPYHISTKLIKLLILEKDRIDETILMVQKEFADKLSAQPGSKNYSSFALYAKFYLDIETLFIVSKNCFYPKPKIDSAVIKIRPKTKPLFEVDEELFFKIIRSAFWGKRKALLNCLLKGPYIQYDKKIKTIPFFQENAQIRGEKLILDDFFRIYQEILKYEISEI